MQYKFRKFAKSIFRIYGNFANIPFYLHKNQISPPKHVPHHKWLNYLSAEFNKPKVDILEIGSRNVTGANFRDQFDIANYVGFDYFPGENVDVVGDAHRLSDYFPERKFDLVFSSAVFEHLYMPWIVAEEISKILNVDGVCFIETHFSFESHERPWNFFQFSDMGLCALFNRKLGFEILDVGMSNPINGYFSRKSDPNLRFRPIKEMYCHSEILCRKVSSVDNFDWHDCTAEDLVGDTHYPAPKNSGA